MYYYKNINILSLEIILIIKYNNNEIYRNVYLSSIKYF